MPIRLPVVNVITSVGSDPSADVRLVTVPAQWAVIHRDAGGVTVRVLATGASHALAPGGSVTVDGVALALEERAAAGAGALEGLASALVGADTPEAAVRGILRAALEASGADSGAVIVSEAGAYVVAAAMTADGRVLHEAAELLSDTIVRDVLGTAQAVCLTDVAGHDRYARVPSVVALQLRSAACLPMRVDGRALGALYLGKRDGRARFSERAMAQLEVLAAMAVPFVASLRRPGPVSEGALLGDAPAMRELRALIARVGPSDLSVLIRGASGTGKELVARAIHAASPRAGKPMIAINCAAVPESLLGAELFGYRKGAFTGAAADRMGLVEAADGSTLFLDEVGDMPPAMQAALLRVLEQREVVRLGEHTPRPVDFRVIAATHRDLAAPAFREDLLFRLQEITMELPSLAERGDDVLLLAKAFLRQAEQQLGLGIHGLSADAEAAVRAHAWPGNVRELRAAMRRAAILADERVVRAKDLQLPGTAVAESSLGDMTRPLAEARDEFVRRYVEAAVERCGGNREDAARELGIGVRTLYRYLT